MSYIGVQPVPRATRVRTFGALVTATNTIAIPGGFSPSNIEVFIDGLYVQPTDYNDLDGFNLVFITTLVIGTEYVVMEARTFESANHYTKVESDTDAKWLGTPIGGTLTLPTHLAGVDVPPTNSSKFRYILLTAGLDGVGQYNETILTGETVTGSAPLVVATAVINLAASPIDGLTVNLLNSEGRYIKPGTTSGAVANDKMQRITGDTSTQSDQGVIRTDAAQPSGSDLKGAFSIGSNTYPFRVGTGTGTSRGLDFDSANSPNARTGTSTDVKNIEYTYYMRVA
jgi:hypothetical protein